MADKEIKVKYHGRDVIGVEIPIVSANEQWSSLALEDGTTVRMRTVVSSVIRLKDEYKDDGDPVYMINAQQVIATITPPELKRAS